MRKIRTLSTFIFVVFAACAFAEDVGTGRIPMKVRYAGVVVEPGSYEIEIVDESNNSYIVLNKNAQVVARDLAIKLPANSTISKPQIQVFKVADQDLLRVRIRSGNFWYYAYMETKW